MKRKALGKGLKAFLPEDYGILKEERLVELDIDRLKPNPLQPRLDFDAEALEELASSIKETGILQPILAVPDGEDFMIIVGERRWRAAQKIGLQKVPTIVRTMSREQQLEASLIENLQREDLNPIEIAQAYKKLSAELNYTQQEVAEKVGKDRASVANYMRLLKLPREIQDMLSTGKLSMGHARALITITDVDFQILIARQASQKGLSVREVEKLIHRKKTTPKTTIPPETDPDLLAVQEDLLKRLGTKVAISGDQDKGIIKIYYYSLDELNRIYDFIKG